jgi:DNA-binding MarR family transcriptional regulator
MINDLEYKLNGSAFKLLQYLKVDNSSTQREIAEKVFIEKTSVTKMLKLLEDYDIITVKKKGKGNRSGHYYIINEVEKWTI